MNRQINSPRFNGVGIINALFYACCFIVGAVLGIALGAVL